MRIFYGYLYCSACVIEISHWENIGNSKHVQLSALAHASGIQFDVQYCKSPQIELK